MKPLMPKAVAIWLIENTAVSFQQIADYCGLHILEVESLANEETDKSLKPVNPITLGELSQTNITECEKDPSKPLVYIESQEYNAYSKTFAKNTTQSKFKRKAKPEAILWVISNYPEINDYQVSKLLSTTTNTVKAIRAKSYWNYKNLVAKNPVSLGLVEEEALVKLIESSKKVEEPVG
ncbi:MAG: DUF1013 domain-containing protein [Alphaproteobacteria bacterium]|jgi:hypothetical protein|nr:DUF1013 domain-containing protein [Alphaproteobacteria bacterium]